MIKQAYFPLSEKNDGSEGLLMAVGEDCHIGYSSYELSSSRGILQMGVGQGGGKQSCLQLNVPAFPG